MTPESRGRILRLAIAVNLAIVATGVALLFPAQPVVLLAAYAAAAGLAAWKGGWEGGVLATAISTVILLLMFNATFDESHVIGFIAAGVIVTAIVEAARPRRVKQAVADQPAPQFGRLVAVDPPLDERERLTAERRELAKSLERAAAAQLEEQRQAAQRGAENAKTARLTTENGKRDDRSKRG